MHMGAVSQELGMQKMIIPYAASVQGAYGLVSADVVHEDQATMPMNYPVELSKVNDIFNHLTEKITRQLQDEGFEKENIVIERSIDMRYRRQVHLVTTPVAMPGVLKENDLEQTCDTFEKLYTQRYGKESAYREAGMEMVIFRVSGIGRLGKPKIREEKVIGADPEAAFVETRKIYCHNTGDIEEARGYDLEKLLPGNKVEGPSIIWTPITTIVVNPGHRATLDQYRNVVLTW